jgi:cysteinyl-tRNA synthetase
MTLRVYNTLTRQKEPFQTVEPNRVRMYVCGPTVYKPSHIGHMVGPVIFDTVKRYLQYLGYQVKWIVNITDVDDKLINRAKELGVTVEDLATKMTADYKSCLKKLGVVGIDEFPKATEHIPEMIAIIQKLIEAGYAYPAGGDVYFDVTKDEDYGKLCNRDPEQMAAGARIEVSAKKRSPGDFALWKGAKPGEPAWDSPWGPGRPGWHIECSAMSMKHLGETLDIHGGGLDLQFPHHENELAQSESYTGKPFARYWMHNGLMKLGAAKMAGSVGNVVNVVDLLQRTPPETVRYLILGTHYRSPIDFNEERLAEMQRALDSFHRFFERYERVTGQSYFGLEFVKTRRDEPAAAGALATEVAGLRRRFLEHMDDDFNTGGAVGVLYELLGALNRFADQQHLEDPQRRAPAALAEWRGAVLTLRELAWLLGLFQEAPPRKSAQADGGIVAGLMQLLLDLRKEARQAKNFALADQIRQRLAALGVMLEDRAGGTTWRLP